MDKEQIRKQIDENLLKSAQLIINIQRELQQKEYHEIDYNQLLEMANDTSEWMATVHSNLFDLRDSQKVNK